MCERHISGENSSKDTSKSVSICISAVTILTDDIAISSPTSESSWAVSTSFMWLTLLTSCKHSPSAVSKLPKVTIWLLTEHLQDSNTAVVATRPLGWRHLTELSPHVSGIGKSPMQRLLHHTWLLSIFKSINGLMAWSLRYSYALILTRIICQRNSLATK